MADTSGLTSSTAVQSSLNLWSVFPSWEQLEETVLGPVLRGPSAKPHSLFYTRMLCSYQLLLIPSFLTLPTHQFIKVQRPLPGKGAKMHGPELPSVDPGVGPGLCVCSVTSAWHTHVRAPLLLWLLGSAHKPSLPLAASFCLGSFGSCSSSVHPLNPSKSLVLLAHPHPQYPRQDSVLPLVG